MYTFFWVDSAIVFHLTVILLKVCCDFNESFSLTKSQKRIYSPFPFTGKQALAVPWQEVMQLALLQFCF